MALGAWRDGAWSTDAWRVGSWRVEAGVGTVVNIFNRISRARTRRIARLNYRLTPIGDGTYTVVESSGISTDKYDSISYEGYEFP